MCSFIADLRKYVYMVYFLCGRGGPPPLTLSTAHAVLD